MDSLIEIIMNGEVTPQDLIFWLGSSNLFPLLSEYEHIKADFAPYFLNFLREQTNSIMNTSSHTGLTPNKSTTQLRTKYSSPYKIIKTASKKGFCSKAKTLNFSEAAGVLKNVPSEDIDYKKTPQKSFSYTSPSHLSESPMAFTDTFSSTMKSYKTSTPRVESSKSYQKRHDLSARGERFDSSGSKVSERKTSLADYFVFESAKKAQKKNKDSQKEANSKAKEISFNIGDSDAFPIVGCQINRKEEQKKRRINPTRVVDCEKNGTVERKKLMSGVPSKQVKDNCFIKATESETYSLVQERKLLKEGIDKLQKVDCTSLQSFGVRPSSKESSRTILSVNKSSLNTIFDEDALSLVTSQKELRILANVYSGLILCNMVSNILVELYFLLQLLTAKEEFIDEMADSKFLNSPYNCIYFSVKTLSQLTDCLSLFDKSFLKTLSDNPRVYAFDPSFKGELLCIIENSSAAKAQVKPQSKSPILSVSFQSETDNKNNFPDTVAFQNFKKQRDLFYELLRIWEENHLVPGWSFSQGLGTKVKQIFTLQSGLTNLTHMARLFQSQLLTMCKGDERVNMTNGVEDVSVLCQLRRQQPEKYKRLFERLITPSKFGGPVPTPSFPGAQEFFRDFIITAANHAFNIHLRNVLITKITELNNFNCQIAELEDKEHGEQLKDEITSRVQNLRLLAKFLGFLEFLPYQVNEALPDLVVDNQVALRNKVIPPIPLLRMLREGVLSGCLVVVIPWMVELLSMVDSVALHTQYYLTLIFELILIYKILYLFKYDNKPDLFCNKCSHIRKLRMISSGNCLLLKLLIGWLLSLPNVPEGLFYVQEEEADIDNKDFRSLKCVLELHYFHLCASCTRYALFKYIELESNDSYEVVKDLSFSTSSPVKMDSKKTPLKTKGHLISPLKTPSKFLHVSMIETPEGTPDKEDDSKDTETCFKLILDSYELFDYNTIYSFCPFVHELKEALIDFSGSYRSVNGSNIRKITPLSAPDKGEDAPGKSIQNLLEENFFHNQSSSTKKTVDFMVERIVANVMRSLRSVVIPKLKEGCVVQLKSLVASTAASTPPERAIETVDKHVQQLSNELSVKVRQEIIDQMNSFLNDDLQGSLQFLLPLDISKTSLEMCCQIVKRLVQEKVNAWVISHLTTGFCTNELTTEAHKYLKQILKSLNCDTSLNMEASLVSNGNLSSSHLHNNSIAGFNSVLLEDQQSLDLSSSLITNFANIQLSKDVIKEYSPIAKIHNDQVIFPSRLLLDIKSDLKKIMIPSNGTKDYGVDVLGRLVAIRKVLEQRQDTTLMIVKALQTLCADWMAALCVCLPHCITNDAIKSFVSLWNPAGEGLFPNSSVLCVFLSARTIMLLGQNEVEVQPLSWQKLQEIVVECVINSKLLNPAQLQDAFIALLRDDWTETICEGISNLSKRIVEALNKHKEFSTDSEALQFTEWVSWVTSDMEV